MIPKLNKTENPQLSGNIQERERPRFACLARGADMLRAAQKRREGVLSLANSFRFGRTTARAGDRVLKRVNPLHKLEGCGDDTKASVGSLGRECCWML